MAPRAARSRTRNVLTPEQITTAARMFAVLADPTRLRIIHELLDGERTVTALARTVGISQSATSHQIAKLRDLGLVTAQRQGTTIQYALASEHVSSFFREALYQADHTASGTAH